jgi:hypothetical protein
MATKIGDGTGVIGEGTAFNTAIESWYGLELSRTGSAVPFIDFKQDANHTSDYDARIRKVNDSGTLSSDNGLWFQVGGAGSITTGMILTGEGYMRQQNIPVFDVSSTAGGSGYVNMNQSHVNNGGHFNFSTDRFTAPVSGVYLFYATAIKSSSNTGAVTRIYIRKNGSDVTGDRQVRLSEGGNYGSNGVGMWMMSMSAGDYAQYYVDTYSTHAASEYTYWGGRLLY